MSERFDAQEGLIIVPTVLTGPKGSVVVGLALDTGATTTLISASRLVAIGCDSAAGGEHAWVTTGSGMEFVPKVSLRQIETLGRVREDFAVLCHTLPPTAAVDGLLGLDFLREQHLTIDFREGLIALE